MKVTQIIRERRADSPYYTFEIFPPKTSQGTANLLARLERMIASLHPSWIHVTWSAGGTSSDKSLDLVRAVKQLGVDVCLHLTCTNMERAKLDETLEALKSISVQNVLALRGDPPRGEEYWVASDPEFQHGADLVRYIRRKYGDYFCIGVAGYPEGHCDSSDKECDTRYLLEKQQAGADFVVTQLFYDTAAYLRWQEDARSQGLTIPILPGIMPIQTFGGFSRMTHMCKTFIPDHVVAALDPIKGDDAAVKDYGVSLAVDMITTLWQESGVRGFHFCTLNLEKSVQRIVQELGWAGQQSGKDQSASRLTGGGQENGLLPTTTSSNGTSSKDPVAATAADLPLNGHAVNPRIASLATGDHLHQDSQRRTNSPTSWDEFPNGRFGDARSPAYGDLDGWGVSLKLTPAEALRRWGAPSSYADISQIFVQYLQGGLSAIPWSDEPLRSETNSILRHLLTLNTQKNWWTVGSQPAVDGCPSEDEVHGFGPAGGYVYQKAFVEFFGDYEDVLIIQKKAAEIERTSKRRKVTFYAAAADDEDERSDSTAPSATDSTTRRKMITNMQRGDANAVTWGIFPGKEIVTTTLIEEMSFVAWKEEAFSIWTEWEHLYPLRSPARQLLQKIGKTRWLISVVHHDYKDSEGLWRFLLD